MLGAVPVPPGTYDVVTDTVTTGVIAHEAFGHGMETDMFLKERARAADYIGKRVGSDLVNIVDDPSMAGAYGSYFVDDEGRGASPTQIIRDGILQGGLTDLYSASRLGISRTANGRRESVHRKAYARMSNTFFTPGSSTREELLEQPGRRRPAAPDAERDGGSQGLGHPDLGPLRGRVQARQAHRPDLLAGGDHRLRARRAGRCLHGFERFRAGRRHLRQGLEGAGAGHLWRSSSPHPLPAGLSMDRRLTDALERHPAVHDWTARRQVGRGVQIYLVGNQVENVRQIERESYEVEVFNDHQADGEPSRGAAKVPVSRADLERLPEVLETATTMASLVNNPPWSLPEPHDMPEVALADASLTSIEGALAAAREAADRIRALAANEAANDVRLSAAELFVTTVEEELRNSRGLTGMSVATHLLLEITLLARQGGEEAEYFRQAAARRMADLRIDETVTEGSRMARDKLRATAPRTRVGPVVMSGEALVQIFGNNAVAETGALLNQASAAFAYSKISRLEVGRPIWGDREPTGDLITVRANARLPYGVASYRFDPDGVAAEDLLVIEDGVLRARPATQRYAQYLGVPASGRPGMTEVAPGSTPMADLLDGDGSAYHVLAFSAPNVDELTGEFGMEIRIGYERGPDGVRPLTGGSVTGNLFEALADVRLSSETRVMSSYAGPVAIRFGSLQVAGQD